MNGHVRCITARCAEAIDGPSDRDVMPPVDVTRDAISSADAVAAPTWLGSVPRFRCRQIVVQRTGPPVAATGASSY